MKFASWAACVALALAFSANVAAQSRMVVRQHLSEPPQWYQSEQAKQYAENILSWQSPQGGWPSNRDTGAAPNTGDRDSIRGTYDNSATTDELRYLARMATHTKQQRYIDAFNKGLDYCLNGQYPNGGWPQSSPPSSSNYSRYITFNDGAMPRVMMLVREVATDDANYGFVDSARRKRCANAWEKGIDVILKCQVKVDGKLTAWCAQHDEKDFTPQKARAFEPISLSSAESVGVLQVLMAVEKPSPRIIAAVEAAVAWLDSVKIHGIRTEDRPQEGAPRGIDRFVIEDPSAPPMWARFYEIGTNKPLFGDRDNKVYYKLADISHERRTGYRWLSYWPKNLLEQEYPNWKARISAR